MTATAEQPKVLIIDDEMGPRESLRMLLKPSYQVHTADNVEKGLELLRENRPDVVVSDIRMPGSSGIEGLRRIREIDPHVAVIMLTGFGALETAQEALRLGANDYINKPFDAVKMRDVISKNVERTRTQRKSLEAAEEIKQLNNRLRNELAQKEKMASLGQASAEFVHDLSNPLTIVWGYVQILGKKLEQAENASGKNGSSPKEIGIIEQNVRLCRDLLTMWQSYGNGNGFRAKPVSVSKIVRDVAGSVGGIAAENGIELNVEICEDECSIMGEPTQLTRAIQNVIVNAIQASTEKKSPVSIVCSQRDFYADVRVEDSGRGMPEEVMSKIFDPYFTTKSNKSGTGLGLYITKKVIEDHQGSIKVNSAPETGTTFILRLPLRNQAL